MIDATSILTRLRSLRVAVILATLLGVALPATWMTYSDIQQLRTEYLSQLDRDMAQTAELIAMSMREPIWQFAPDQALSIIEASMLDERIIGVEVFDVSQRPFAGRVRDRSDDQNAVRFSTRVTRQNQVVGHVEILISTADYHRAVAKTLRRAWLRVGISIAASVLLISVLLHFRLVVPIGRLVKASEQIAAGNLSTPIESRRQDEIGRVAEALDAVRAKLSQLIGELERSNEELRQTNESLEQRVADRTADLEAALEKLLRAQEDMVESEKLASLGRVVAGIAHELNTPIGNALTVASTIADTLKPLIGEYRAGGVRRSTLETVAESDPGLRILLRNLEKAAEMIANFKQVAVDQTSEQRRRFDLAKVTDEVLSTLRPSLRKTDHNLEVRLQPGLICDSFPGPYGQILTNLVMNAVVHAFEHKSAGTITVSVEATEGERVKLVVADNGAGMSEDVKRRIFDPFFTTRMGRGGSGLGLNIVLGFVNRVLGGTIRVDSQPDLGTRFIVEFPRIAP